MALRVFPLAQQVDGINLMRQKGGASPSALFDLKNGWVTSQRTIKARGGSAKDVTFPAGTKGCVGFESQFHTFSHAATAAPADARVQVHILRHPTGGVAALAKIHRAFAFLGRLYVVAEFADGVVQHYWIESPVAWTASTKYSYGSTVQPPAANGFYYEMVTLDTTAAWQENAEVAAGDMKQPKVANGFKYEVTATTGTAPIRTSNTEPVWPTTEGATVVERRYITEAQTRPGGPATTDTSGVTTGDGGGGGAGDEYGPFPPAFDTRPL